MSGPEKQEFAGSWLLAPLLAACYPVLSLFVENIDEALWGDVVVCLIAVMVLAALLAFAFRVFFSCKHRASIASALFVFWFFAYSAFLYVGNQIFSFANISNFTMLATLSIVWALLFGLLILLKWYPRDNAKLVGASGLVRWICVFLVGVTCVQGVFASRKQRSAVPDGQSQVSLSEETLSPPRNLGDWQSRPVTRDVYYLVFDRYADAATLQRSFGFDNSEFYAELEKRGFHVYHNARASYPTTLLSMSSTLNMRYHGKRFGSFSEHGVMLQEHEVGKWFIDGGFHYYHIGCSFGPLQKNNLAQTNLSTAFPFSEFSRTLLRMTPIGRLLGYSMKYHGILRQMEAVKAVADDQGPTFAYAHFNTPHHPYVFARDGSMRKLQERFPVGDKEPYIAQLVALNTMVFEVLDEILSKSEETPIIIIQSDEGPYLAPADESLARMEKIAKRTGILSAILIPDQDIAENLPAELVPVNTFRFLFREYLQTPIDMLPERVFWWEGEPYGRSTQELEVTAEVTQFDELAREPSEVESQGEDE